MVSTRRYFLEITALEPFSDEDFADGLKHLIPNSNVKVFKAEEISSMDGWRKQ